MVIVAITAMISFIVLLNQGISTIFVGMLLFSFAAFLSSFPNKKINRMIIHRGDQIIKLIGHSPE